eukprot:jgi/Psemu1/56166/gm1.56166_g
MNRNDAYFVKTAENPCPDGSVDTSKNSKFSIEIGQKVGKSVQFSSVEMREYDICIGDNPSVARGAPISLDWTYQGREYCYSLEDYERSEHFSGGMNRSSGCEFSSSDPLKRPPLERLHLLKDMGYSRGEIKEAMDAVQIIRNQRFQTRRQCERADRFHSIVKTFSCFSLDRSKEHDRLTDSTSTVHSSESTVSSDKSIPQTLVQEVAKQQCVVENRRERHGQWVSKPRDSLELVGGKRKKNMPGFIEIKRCWREKRLYRQKQSQQCEALDQARHKSVKLDL